MQEELDFTTSRSWHSHDPHTPQTRIESVRSRSIRCVFNHEVVKKNELLKDCSQEFVDQVLAELTVVLAKAGDEVIKQDDLADSAYFLNSGKVEVLVGPQEQSVATLSAGSVFGEIALFRKNHKRTATVRALEFCDCRSIHHSVFQKILQRFPKDQARLEAWASSRAAELNRIRDKLAPKRSLWRLFTPRSLIQRSKFWSKSEEKVDQNVEEKVGDTMEEKVDENVEEKVNDAALATVLDLSEKDSPTPDVHDGGGFEPLERISSRELLVSPVSPSHNADRGHHFRRKSLTTPAIVNRPTGMNLLGFDATRPEGSFMAGSEAPLNTDSIACDELECQSGRKASKQNAQSKQSSQKESVRGTPLSSLRIRQNPKGMPQLPPPVSRRGSRERRSENEGPNLPQLPPPVARLSPRQASCDSQRSSQRSRTCAAEGSCRESAMPRTIDDFSPRNSLSSRSSGLSTERRSQPSKTCPRMFDQAAEANEASDSRGRYLGQSSVVQTESFGAGSPRKSWYCSEVQSNEAPRSKERKQSDQVDMLQLGKLVGEVRMPSMRERGVAVVAPRNSFSRRLHSSFT